MQARQSRTEIDRQPEDEGPREGRRVQRDLLATLAEGVAQLTSSPAWRAWLDVQRRFHRYSWGNTLLIAWQRPDATRVAGFHAWRRLGRHVRRGEHGIAILAPVATRLRVVDAETGDESSVPGTPRAFRVAGSRPAEPSRSRRLGSRQPPG
jgi:hypothetical protein